MKLAYEWEKLYSAVRTLVGAGSMKERLADAYLYNVMHIVDHNQLPQDRDLEVKALSEALTAKGDEGQGTVMATVTAMTDDEAEGYAQRIFDLFAEVAQLPEREVT